VLVPNLITIIIAIVLSLSIGYFHYFHKEKYSLKNAVVLFCLRSSSIFLLLLLLINPIIDRVELQPIKPILSILVDNSRSISFLNQEKHITSFAQNIKNDLEIGKKFELIKFSFGSKLKKIDSLSFTDTQTNISEAITSQNQLYSDKIAPIILLTDGNQTVGNDYEFTSFNQKIFPIVFGDTMQYKDLKIAQLNVNKYSYLKNKFPVEVFLSYRGEETISSVFSIFKKGKTVFSKKIQFSPTNNSITIQTNISADKKGFQHYTASIRKIKNEKNIQNNSKKFSVEVIDEQTKVLILTSVLHPDIGALKKSIESNKQRSVEVTRIDDFNSSINDYQLVILYQVTNKFREVIREIKLKNTNYLLVSGVNTNWNFLNNQQLNISKDYLNQIENYTAVLNDSYLTFSQKDIGFNEFPPLKDKFGDITLTKEHQILLYQQINGMNSNQPLLVTFDNKDHKSGILFGEGIWQWRSASFLDNSSFFDFDQFINDLIQYLASNNIRSRLNTNIEAIYPSDFTIDITAYFRDKNYKFDKRASLEITLTNTSTNKTRTYPFRLINNSYQTTIENLNSGEYTYVISVVDQQIQLQGNFRVKKNQIEEQFMNVNYDKLSKIAKKTGGKLYFKNDFSKFKKVLLNDKSFLTTQKERIITQQLIDWKWMLGLIIFLLTIEWFLRKFLGKI
jgi:hypothetical protein